MFKNKKNKISLLVGGASIAILGAGSLALFSDRAATGVTGKAGTLGIDVNSFDMTNKGNINPGDNDEKVSEKASTTPHDITFNVENTGNKSVRTRHTLLVSLKGENGVLNPSVVSVLKAKGQELEGKEYLDAEGKVTDAEKAVAIKYVVLSDVINGTGDNAEVETDGKDAKQSYKYLLKMDKDAKNEYQGADLNIDLIVDAIQFRNTTEEDWTNVSKETIKGSMTGVTVEEGTVPSK